MADGAGLARHATRRRGAGYRGESRSSSIRRRGGRTRPQARLFLRHPLVRQALDFATPSQDIVDKLLKGRPSVRGRPAARDLGPQSEHRGAAVRPRAGQGALGRGRADPERRWRLEGEVPTEDPLVLDGEVRKFEMELWGISGDAQQQQIFQVIEQAWNQAGVKTTANFQDISTIWGPEGYQWNPETMTACLYSWFNGNDPDDRVPTGTRPRFQTARPDWRQRDRLLPRVQLPGGDRHVDRAARRKTDQEARKDLLGDPGAPARAGSRHLHLLGQVASRPCANNIGGFWPSAFNRMLWNVQEWYFV